MVKTEPQGFPDSKESLALLAVTAGLGDPESTEAPVLLAVMVIKARLAMRVRKVLLDPLAHKDFRETKAQLATMV